MRAFLRLGHVVSGTVWQRQARILNGTINGMRTADRLAGVAIPCPLQSACMVLKISKRLSCKRNMVENRGSNSMVFFGVLERFAC